MHRQIRTAPGTLSLVIFLAVNLSPAAAGQDVGTCTHGEAQSDLDVNHVRARMYNTGTLFWRGSGAHYRVPQQAKVSSIFLATIQMGGLVGGEYRMAGSDYGPFSFWPGPLDAHGRAPEDCSEFDRIYSIRRDSITHYEATGEVSKGLAEWPVHLGAPVVDGDGIPGNYDLSGGDRPALIGDEMLWWVMNDAENAKQWMISPPLPLEIQMSAFAFNDPEVLRKNPRYQDLKQALRNTTFYRYRLRYLGDEPLEEAWFSIWTDLDAGLRDRPEQFVGSDSAQGLGFAYRGPDSYASVPGFEGLQPAIGFDFFRGPILAPDTIDNDGDGVVDEAEERGGATRFLMHEHGASVMGWPHTPEQAHDLLRGIWLDGSPLTLGGSGYGGRTPVHFMFSGNPPSFWSEENTDRHGSSNTPGYRHFNISTGPFRLEPGETEDIYLGIVWSVGRDRLDSVYKLKSEDALIQSVFDELIEPYQRKAPPAPPNYAMVHHYPSPMRDTATLTYSLPRQEHVSLIVYDMLGREVLRKDEGLRPAGGHRVEIDVSSLASGIYVYEFQSGRVRGARTLVIAR